MHWRKEYVKRRIHAIRHGKRAQLQQYRTLASQSHECRDDLPGRMDFLMSYLMFGAGCEDYFVGRFYHVKNPFMRNHHVGTVRLNLLKDKANTSEAVSFLNSKTTFDDYYNDYLGRKWCSPSELSEDEFVEKMKYNGEVFVKPLEGFGGTGAYRAKADEETLRKVYRDCTATEEKYIVEEYYQQTGFLHDVNPSSLNTIRIITVRNKEGIAPLFAYYRAGGAGACVDNFYSGGIYYTIDLKDGRLQKGVSFKETGIKNHPSTGLLVAGCKVPNWDKVLDFAIKLHEMAPEGAGFIGWDLCVSGDNIIVIEGNAGPGFGGEISFSTNSWKKVRKYLDSL
jgi:ribosomal protein L20A (L18A)